MKEGPDVLLLGVLLAFADASGSLVVAFLQDLDDGIVLVLALKVVLERRLGGRVLVKGMAVYRCVR